MAIKIKENSFKMFRFIESNQLLIIFGKKPILGEKICYEGNINFYCTAMIHPEVTNLKTFYTKSNNNHTGDRWSAKI